MAFDRIQFDPNSVPLRSGLRVLATIRTPGELDNSIYLDSDGEKLGIRRADYISETIEPGLFKRDEVSVVSNWPRFGGPHIVVLPEGQRLLLGQLSEGVTVEVALWRNFIMAQTFSNRILVAAIPSGIAAFQPRPRSAATQSTEPRYQESHREVVAEKILKSVPEEAIETLPSPPDSTSNSSLHIEVSTELENLEKILSEIEEIQPQTVVDSLPETEPEPVAATLSVTTPDETLSRKSAKLMLLISDLLITFAIFAIMYAGYQTVWSKQVSEKHVTEAKAEVERTWKEAPATEPAIHQGFALAYIPRLKDKVWGLPISKGVSTAELMAGLGSYPDNALPGSKGNFALAGHRSTFGEPLADIDQLQQNDEVIIQTADRWYVYKLIFDEIVDPDATWVLDANPGGIVNKTGVEEMITLTTCDPRWGSTHRWIWWGVLAEVRPIDQVPDVVAVDQEKQVQ